MADWTDSLQVFCADVGSIANGRFAWARRIAAQEGEEVHAPANIDSLADAVVHQLDQGRPVALGFEAPLFVPVPQNSAGLGKARPCDLNAPAWASQVGASARMATGLVQMAWLMRLIRQRVPEAELHLDWQSFVQSRQGLLVWEAFVTRHAKGKTHEEDAAIGLEAFCAQLPTPGDSNANETEESLSLAAAAALWAGWDLAPEQLRAPCLLVRA